MNQFSRKLFLVVLLGYGFTSVKPMLTSECEAKRIGVGVGLFSGLVAFAGCECSSELRENLSDGTHGLAALVGVGVGALAGLISYFIGLENTPIRVFGRAFDNIEWVKSNSLLYLSLNTNEVEIAIRDLYYSSDWPLVDAKFKLDQLRTKLKLAQGLLEEVLLSGEQSFAPRCREKIKEIIDLRDKVTAVFHIVTSLQDYNVQLDRFQRYQQSERKRISRERDEAAKRYQKERQHKEQMDVERKKVAVMENANALKCDLCSRAISTSNKKVYLECGHWMCGNCLKEILIKSGWRFSGNQVTKIGNQISICPIGNCAHLITYDFIQNSVACVLGWKVPYMGPIDQVPPYNPQAVPQGAAV